jgi:hypothetical protein
MNKAKKNSIDKSDYLMLVSKAVFTSPHRPTTSSKSFRPDDNSIIHLLTAFDERSGVRSSSDTSIQPSDRTAKRIDSGSVFIGKLRRLENKQKLTNHPRQKFKQTHLYVLSTRLIAMLVLLLGIDLYIVSDIVDLLPILFTDSYISSTGGNELTGFLVVVKNC